MWRGRGSFLPPGASPAVSFSSCASSRHNRAVHDHPQIVTLFLLQPTAQPPWERDEEGTHPASFIHSLPVRPRAPGARG